MRSVKVFTPTCTRTNPSSPPQPNQDDKDTDDDGSKCTAQGHDHNVLSCFFEKAGKKKKAKKQGRYASKHKEQL